ALNLGYWLRRPVTASTMNTLSHLSSGRPGPGRSACSLRRYFVSFAHWLTISTALSPSPINSRTGSAHALNLRLGYFLNGRAAAAANTRFAANHALESRLPRF